MVVDAIGNRGINQSEVFSGMYAYVNVTFFPYSFGGKKGIGCGLGPVMKRRDGEPLGGSAPSAAQAFGVQPGTAQAATPQYGAAGYAPQQPQYMQAPSVDPITGLPY